jgi:hypothetical protein
VNRHHRDAGIGGPRPDDTEDLRVQQQRLFTEHVPAASDGVEHRLGVQGRWRADVHEVD